MRHVYCLSPSGGLAPGVPPCSKSGILSGLCSVNQEGRGCAGLFFSFVSLNSQHCKHQGGACAFQGCNRPSSTVTATHRVLHKDRGTGGMKGEEGKRSPGRGSRMCRALPSLQSNITFSPPALLCYEPTPSISSPSFPLPFARPLDSLSPPFHDSAPSFSWGSQKARIFPSAGAGIWAESCSHPCISTSKCLLGVCQVPSARGQAWDQLLSLGS